MLADDQGVVGTWILILYWQSIHSPFLNSNFLADVHFSIFFKPGFAPVRGFAGLRL